MSVKRGHFRTVEEHALLQLLLDERLEHLPYHIEEERLLHDVNLKK